MVKSKKRKYMGKCGECLFLVNKIVSE